MLTRHLFSKSKPSDVSNDQPSACCMRVRAFAHKIYSPFAALRGARRELWLIFVLKFFESYAYFAMSVNFVLYLSSEPFHYDDIEAGTYFGVWGVLISMWGLLTGVLVDKLGVKWSMVLGGVISTAGRLLFALARTRTEIIVSSFVLMPIGMSLGIPVMTIGIKQCTAGARTMDIAFALFYSVMNVAAMLSGELTDVFQSLFKNGVDVGGTRFAPLHMVFLSSAAASLFYTLLALFAYRPHKQRYVFPGCAACCNARITCHPATWIRALGMCCGSGSATAHTRLPEENADNMDDFVILEEGEAEEEAPPTKLPSPPQTNDAPTTTVEKKSKCARLLEPFAFAFRDGLFWRLVLFSTLITGVNLIFRHMDATFPKYALRTIGKDAPYGSLYSINPFMIIFLAPLFQAVLAHYDAYWCIVAGSFIAALSVFALPLDIGSYWSSVVFIVTLSVGEAIYSPRVYGYTMALAPDGHEGLYSTLSSAPMFAAKLVVGIMSGHLLHAYCPEPPAHQRCDIMWIIIGAISLTSPILLLIFACYIHDKRVRALLRAYNGTVDEKHNEPQPRRRRSARLQRRRSHNDLEMAAASSVAVAQSKRSTSEMRRSTSFDAGNPMERVLLHNRKNRQSVQDVNPEVSLLDAIVTLGHISDDEEVVYERSTTTSMGERRIVGGEDEDDGLLQSDDLSVSSAVSSSSSSSSTTPTTKHKSQTLKEKIEKRRRAFVSQILDEPLGDNDATDDKVE